MNPLELEKTIYLGDRSIKKITLDIQEETISLTIDCLSRIRDPSGEWNFYTDEDIENGLIVITGVVSFCFSPDHVMPNDKITSFEVSQTKHFYEFHFAIDSQLEDWSYTETHLFVNAKGMHLLNPKHPDKKILS